MKQIILIILLTACSNLLAGIKAFVDRQDIHANETFMLTVELDEYTSDTPDLSVIPNDINVLSNSKYHRSSTINGVSSTQLGWKIQLMVDEPGIYTIPSIEVGNQSTSPIQIKVKPSTDTFSTDDQVEAIMLKAEVSKEDVFVQEQILFKLKLFRAVQTQYASLTEPAVENAIIEKLGEDNQYETVIDGNRYLVLERLYAIFPQESGKLEIPKVVFSADVVKRNSSSFGRVLGRTRPVSIATEAKTITVKPYPDGHSGLWLPSKNLKVESRWSDIKDKTVGQPSTWTITLTGVGLHENQLPEIELPDTPNIKWYPDTAEKSRAVSSDGIVGKRVERIAVVPTKAGTVKLPELTFRWFNTETGEYETSVLAEQTIRVQPNPEQSAIKPEPSIQLPADTQPPTSANNRSYQSGARWWMWSTYLFAGLWISTLVLYFLKSNRNSNYPTNDSSTLYDKIDSRTKLVAAINAKNRTAIYQHLNLWMSELSEPCSFRKHLEKLTSTEIKQSLSQLETSLYSQTSDAWQDFNALKSWLKSIENDLKRQSSSGSSEKLPELYPKS